MLVKTPLSLPFLSLPPTFLLPVCTALHHRYVSMSPPPASVSGSRSTRRCTPKYPLAIDTKDFGLLTSTFTTSATANHTGYLSNLIGIAAFQTGLAGPVAKIDTQHLPGTTAISINNCTSANSTAYFQASLFGKGGYEGQVLYLYGLYADVLGLVKGKG
jgi:hypothetical protein